MVVTAAVVIQQLHWTVSDINDVRVEDGGDEGDVCDDVDDSSHPTAGQLMVLVIVDHLGTMIVFLLMDDCNFY